jgi:superfamily II DNA or RNA helicase
MTVLRPYQAQCIDDTREAFGHGSMRVCVVLPTGAGKTVIGATMATMAMARGKRVGWISHRTELDQQARSRLPDGVWTSTVQGMLASGSYPHADLLIVDECHHYTAEQWGSALDHYRHASIVGLTATPERADGSPLGDVFQSLVVGATYTQLLDGGWIVPCHVFAPDRHDSSRLAMPVSEAIETYSQDMQSIVFSRTVAEARSLADCIDGLACVDGETPGDTRADVVAAFRSGVIQHVSNVYVFTEGFDAPNATVCILARGASHASTYLQMVGRVLRSAPDKTFSVLVDLCGSYLMHGHPTADREYSLDGEPIHQSRKPVIWQCRRCGYALPAQPPNRICTFCGAIMPEPDALRIARAQLKRRERNAIATKEEKQQAWQSLQRQARERGYSPGWAYHRFRGRYGHAP